MTQSVEPRKTKERSPSYPFIPLTEAIERAQNFFREERRGTAPMQRAARHWNYSPASSGLLQTISSMKQYGLLQDEGSGKDRQLRLTELALRILLDTREESTERDAYKRQAALSPPISAEVHDKWPDGLPSDSTLNHFLVLERGFNQVTALKVVKILKENEVFTKAFEVASISDAMRTNSEFMDENISDLARSSAVAKVTEALLERTVGERRARSFGSLVVTPNCTIHLLADGSVTQDGLKKLIKYVELILDSFPPSEPSAQESGQP